VSEQSAVNARNTDAHIRTVGGTDDIGIDHLGID
jgi:hypothetical protein